MRIPFLDLQKLHERYRDELVEVATRIIDSGRYIFGPEMEGFEKEFAAHCGATEAIGTASCLDALKLTIRAYKEMGAFSDGDEILVAANAYIATVLAITENGLIPVFVEPDEESRNIDISLLENHISEKTKGIMALHLYGRVSYSKNMQEIADRHNLKIIEDAAQATGAVHQDKRVGSLGDAAGFSFFPTKNLGALGDAGMITTNDIALADMVRSLRYFGGKNKPHEHLSSTKSRMDELQAAMLSVKLNHLDQDNKARQAIARRYRTEINNGHITLPQTQNEEEHVWHLFVVQTEKRDALADHLQEHGIATLVHYAVPPFKETAFPQWNKQQHPIAEKMADTVLSIPLHPALTHEEQTIIIEACNSYAG